jgi:hypothetical protein
MGTVELIAIVEHGALVGVNDPRRTAGAGELLRPCRPTRYSRLT